MSADYYIRGLTRELEGHGAVREARHLMLNGVEVSGHTVPDPKLRYRLWQLDALVWALEELLERRGVYAFRGLVQATGYGGILQGLGEVPHNSVTSDAFTYLKNEVERLVQIGEQAKVNA